MLYQAISRYITVWNTTSCIWKYMKYPWSYIVRSSYRLVAQLNFFLWNSDCGEVQCALAPTSGISPVVAFTFFYVVIYTVYIYIRICLGKLLWNCETKRPRQTAGCHLRCAFRSGRGNPVRIGPGYSTPTLRRRETRTSVLQIPWQAVAEEKVQLASPTMCRANLGEPPKKQLWPVKADRGQSAGPAKRENG